MNLPTPFERVLADLSNQAQRDPLGAFRRLQDAWNVTLTDGDVLRLCSFSANLGAGMLGRFDDAIAFLDQLQGHQVVQEGDETFRSIERAICVCARVAGHAQRAEEALMLGARTESERCRVEVMTAQILLARQRLAEAAEALDRARPLLQALGSAPQHSEIRSVAVTVAAHISRFGAGQIHEARKAILAASALLSDEGCLAKEWVQKHEAHFQRAEALTLAGEPQDALVEVQAMLALENANPATNTHRAFTTLAACNAQRLRGQFQIARQAATACRQFLANVEPAALRQEIETRLSKLEQGLPAAG
jgi:tetratricopeptide (TPR) repeat protein